MVAAISGSTQREPLVVGKPSTFMMDYVANKYIFQTPYSHSPLCFGCN
jgi:ribonucleotide monophosphatase NagD (HAD superfamily)